MDLDTNLTSSCRITVYLAPVYPIKRSVFTRYVQLIRQFTIIRLNDITPDTSGDHAIFTSQSFQEGQVHFDFTTHYSGDHGDLVDFQPHRRLFGVIGIMDCQEWQDQDLKTGYQHFIDSLEKYPSHIVTRCFGFDPTETQPDDTKGLIMIPDVGDKTFYMATLISDFTSEILTQFSILAKSIGQHPRSDSAPRSTNYASPPHRQSAPPSQQLSNHSDAPADSPPRHSASTATLPSSSTNTGHASRAKKRLPGRIKKLYGDFYLLSGRLPDARNLYLQAIDMTKITSDYLWLASAIEGYVCTTLLLEQIQGPQPTRKKVGLNDATMASDPPPGKEGGASEDAPLTVSFFLEQYNAVLHYYAKEFGNTTTATYKAIDDVPNNDDGGFVANMTGNATVASLMYAEACLKVARFLLTVYLNGKLDSHALSLLMRGVITSSPSSSPPSSPPPSLPATPISLTHPQHHLGLQDESGVERWDVGLWTTRVWESTVSNLTVIDQIHLMAQMTFIYNSIGYHRKAAWMKYQSIHLMLPILLHQRAKSSLVPKRGTTCQSLANMDSRGILTVLKWICKVYGVDNLENDAVLVQQEASGTPALRKTASSTSGWPSLQMAVLRKCIITAESLCAYTDMLHYTTTLLKNMYPYIPKEEQIRLANSIQRIITLQKRLTVTKKPDINDNYWGVNIINSIKVVPAIPRKQLYQHPLGKKRILSAISGHETERRRSSDPSETTDPFIYNPFTQKKTYEKEQCLLIQHEVADFQVSLTNPFGFDLELQNIQLCTSGVSFDASCHSAVIPAYGSIHLRLSGVPQQAGILRIRGCFIKIVGFAEQEFLLDRVKSGSQDTLQNEFIVVPEEPLVKLKYTSLIQGAMMLFEGERTHLNLTLENIGNVPVDFVAVSFTDNALINSGSSSSLSMEQQYELERLSSDTKVIAWQGKIMHKGQIIGDQTWLPPDATLDITLDIYGQRGSTHGAIQVDYGYLNNKATSDLFYTRQLYLPIVITVYSHLKSQSWDILSVQLDDLAKVSSGDDDDLDGGKNQILAVEKILGRLARAIGDTGYEELQNRYCLATIDIQNKWSFPFEVLFTINNGDNGLSDEERSLIHVNASIPPGATSRILLPIKRFLLSDEETSQPITLENRKQFVVAQLPRLPPSTSLANQEAYWKAQLALFWYRESLLSRVKASWSVDDTTSRRQGDLDLRSSLRLTMDHLSLLKLSDVGFDVTLEGDGVIRTGFRRYSCLVDHPVTMTLRIINQHLNRRTKFILRVQPKEAGLHKVLMQGMAQVILPELALHQQAHHSIPIYFLAQGQYDFLYHAQDIVSKATHYDQQGITVDVR